MDWYGTGFNGTLALVGSQVTQSNWIVFPSVVSALTDPTLVRTQIVYAARNNTVIATPGRFVFGVIAWDNTTDAVPTNAPNPALDLSFDWIIRGVIPFSQDAPIGYQVGPSIDGAFRSSAMRRLGNGSRGILSVVGISGALAASGSLFYSIEARCLLKE